MPSLEVLLGIKNGTHCKYCAAFDRSKLVPSMCTGEIPDHCAWCFNPIPALATVSPSEKRFKNHYCGYECREKGLKEEEATLKRWSEQKHPPLPDASQIADLKPYFS